MSILPCVFSVCSRYLTANQIALQVLYPHLPMSSEPHMSASTYTTKVNFSFWGFSVKRPVFTVFVIPSLCFTTLSNAAPSWLACRTQVEAELCHRGPVLLPCAWSSGPLHQWGHPYGGRHSCGIQKEVSRGDWVKRAKWVNPFIKDSSGMKMSCDHFTSMETVFFLKRLKAFNLLLTRFPFVTGCVRSFVYTVWEYHIV